MKIINLRAYPDFEPDVEFKDSVVARLVAAIVVEVACIALFWATHFPIHGVILPKWWCYPTSALLEVISILCFLSYRKSLRRTNWILRSSGTRQWIKFRSFLNDHLPVDDPQIIELDRADVMWVRPVTIRFTYLTPGGEGDGTTLQTIKYLDIGLNCNTAELDACLRTEEHHAGAGAHGVRGKFNSYPVSVPEPGVIRVRWSDRSGRIKPGLNEAVALFARWTRTREAEKLSADYRPNALAEMPETQQGKSVRELRRIEPISASHAVRKLKKCSLAEARQFLKQI